MLRFNAWRIFWAGILFALVAQIVHSIGALLTMAYYTAPQYLSVWSKIMMPTAGPPPSSFMFYSLILGVISAILIALVFAVVRPSVPGNTIAKKGLNYGLILFILGGIPSYFAMFLLINLPAGLILYWAFETLVVDLIGGMILAWILR
jgi:hypothetical protein